MKKNNHINPLLKIVLFLIITTIFSQSKSNPFLTTYSVAEAKWPMLGEALLEEGSGNSVADWEDATNENVDFGKRKHLYSRGAVRTTVSVVLGGQFIAKLPKIAKNLISKIKRSKGRIKIKDVAKKVTEASQKRLNELLEKIKNLPNKGIDFLNDFAETADETIEAFLKRPSLIDAWKKLNDLGVDDALRRNHQALEVLNQPKFSRDLPETYLDADYITNHLNKFDGGVTKFVSDAPFSAVGPPSGTFVMPKSQADDLIAQAGGDINKLEDLLSLDRGTLGTNPVRLDVENPSGLRMSSGNELGVNEKWIPGGKTSGGTLEATIDQIQLGTFISTPAFKF